MAGQVVQITINVTDGNASEAVQKVVAQLQAIGPAGEAAGAGAGAGLDQVSEHALSARENVRLLNDDLGLRIPRAMQAAIMQSEMLTGAIKMIGPGLIAMGAVDIFAHMAESAYNLYEKYVDIGAAQREFLKNLDEAKDKDFVNVHSLETAQLRLKSIAEQMQDLRSFSQQASYAGWTDIVNGAMAGNGGILASGIAGVYGARSASGVAAKMAGQSQELSPAEQALIHSQNMAQIEADHAGDSELKGQAKITAELQKQLDIDKEKQHYAMIEDKERGNPAGSDAGAGMRAIEDAQARAKARAERLELARQESQQEIELQNEATNAWLTGNSLRAAQETEAIAAVTRKFQEGEISKQAAAAETASIQSKFAAQAAMAQQELDERTKHMNDEAAQAGLRGIPLIQAQLRTQMDAINAEAMKTAGPAGNLTAAQAGDFAQQRADADATANQKIIESRQQFNERIQSLAEASSDYEAQGYARIADEARKSLQSLFNDYRDQYGSDESTWAGYQQAKTAIMANEERQQQQLHQRTMIEITKEEQDAARLGLPEWQKSMLAIEDEYADRVRQVQQDVNAHVMSEQEGAQAVAAAWAKASAEMQLSEEQARDKIASGLQSMFEHPEQFFEKRAMDTAFQLMANEMLSVFKSSSPMGGILQYLFGMGPQMSTSTNPLTAMGSALGLGGNSSLATATTPAMVQFQQGSTTLLTGSQALMSAATSLNSAAGMMGARGGFGMSSSTSGGGFGIPGLGGSGSGGGDTGDMSSTATMLPNIGVPMSSSTWDNATMDPDLSGIGSETAAPDATGNTSGEYLGAAMGIAGGTLMAATSAYSAYNNSNPLAGAVGGAMGGMEAGAALGSIIPGLGTVVGGAIGAIVGGIGGLFAGLFGDKGRGQAEGLDVNTIQPTLAKDLQDYEQGRSGYNQLATEINSLLISAQNQTSQWGSGARDYFNSNIRPEINVVLSSLQKQEIGGRSQVTLSAAQYHGGGWTGDFGDLATSDTEGFIHAMANEFVVNPMAARQHAPLLSAINAGNVSYSNQVQPRMPAAGSGSSVNVTIQALDSKSVAQWAKAGGGRALAAAINRANSQYSGIGRG